MAEVFEFPRGRITEERTQNNWRLACPVCEGTKWDIYVPGEEWDRFLFVECGHCGFVVSLIEDEE